MTVAGDFPDMPAWLRRGTKAFEKLAKKAPPRPVDTTTGKVVDPDAKWHELAGKLGLKRGQYQVHWLQDPRWIENYKVLAAEREAVRAERQEKKKLNEIPKAPKAKKLKPQAAKIARLPQGRIVLDYQSNPKKKGTKQHAWWELLIEYQGRTVEAYMQDKRCFPGTLKNAIKSGHVRILSDDEIKREAGAAKKPTEEQAHVGNPEASVNRPARAGSAREPARKNKPAGKKAK